MDSKLPMPPAGLAVPAQAGRFLRALRSKLAQSGRAIWRALEEQGRLRALRELELLHDGWRFSDPARARVVRDARASLLSSNVPHRDAAPDGARPARGEAVNGNAASGVSRGQTTFREILE